jgi:hypothetical protein
MRATLLFLATVAFSYAITTAFLPTYPQSERVAYPVSDRVNRTLKGDRLPVTLVQQKPTTEKLEKRFKESNQCNPEYKEPYIQVIPLGRCDG